MGAMAPIATMAVPTSGIPYVAMISGFVAFSTIAAGTACVARQGGGEKQRNSYDSHPGNFFQFILLARCIGGIQIGF
jgi:hypothetical protein